MRFLALTFLLLFFLTACADRAHLDQEKMQARIEHFQSKLLDADNDQLDRSMADSLILEYDKFVSKYPDNEWSPEYLFNKANIYRSFGKFDEAIKIYRKIIAEYPNFKMITASHFLIALIYESDLNNKEKAEEVYKEVAQLYPNEKFGQDAAERLKTIHLTDEELIQFFNEKNK